MIRFFTTFTIALLISLGAISKGHTISNLLNHVTEKHITHTHGDDHSHTHSHGEKKHSHQFDLSVLSQVFTHDSPSLSLLPAPEMSHWVARPFSHSTLLLKRYAFSIFRPPIA